jgi:AcrR family transcriptional regulator
MRRERRTQEERSAVTRGAVLDATIDTLIEHGYANTTVALVASRANVSRGALLHHFPSKSDLLLAATDLLFDNFVQNIRGRAVALRESRMQLHHFIDECWEEIFKGRWFYCSLQLIAAARTDPVLRESLVPAIQRLHRALDEIWRGLFHETGLSAARVDTLLNMTLCLMRGMAVQAVLRDDPPYYQAMLDTWKVILPTFVMLQSDTTAPTPANAMGQQ